MRKIWIFIFLLSSFHLNAQEVYRIDQSPQVEINGVTLSSPFTGGINSAQIETIDLTGDGIEEWVTWDINSRQLLVFKKAGETFTHLPEMSYYFPSDISGFVVLADFDGDGKKDLFTSTALGIKAYKNTSTNSQISWEVAQNFLRLDGAGNMQTNNLDTPLIQDLDGDGDLDLVIFHFAGGDYMEFYKNTSVERKGTADMDGFEFPITHWGKFEFCGCGDISFGKTCSGQDLNSRILSDENDKILHAGGHSILYQDLDGDGLEDLLLGRDECNILYFLPNSGSSIEPIFTSFSNSLPYYGDLPTFPLFHIGQQNDDELLVSLNTSEASFNFGIDFTNSIVKIDAQGNADYNFLQNQMIDLGENTKPFHIGSNTNGNLVIISNRIKNGEVIARESMFSLESGVFIFVDIFNEALEKLKLIDAQKLYFRDKENRLHQLITGISRQGSIPTQLVYELNELEYLPLTLTGYLPQRGDYLQFFNFENEDHMLVASQNGSLDLYQIDFASNTAVLQASDFLEFKDNPANRNLSVAVVDKTNPDLYVVDQNGIISKVEDFMQSATISEVLVQIGDTNRPTRLGRNTWITTATDGFYGTTDLILGTSAGGLIYLSSTEESNPDEDEYQIKIYPNPSSGPIKIITNKSSTGTLISSLGQELLRDIEIPANRDIEIQADFLAPGLYILRLESEGKFRESRKIWIR
ncbi:Por secretion system C-terminal sorting domain-containing protein [Algoriphagus locisalis]|uniref:Por secretion system C-terminal sorting domain-containing protein n=1 Tax=Algoriphagus locisalis TaxID=305507 RepID=A0A1I7A508_9BACT|nr:T9SS type A sorting domain-containing protein [Algoriphagus locisalis]SFT70008.1 Por secretion system C-terminal sorting domain-containing protein [Algoriphagus locisalis]